MLSLVLDTIRRHRLCAAGDRVLVAVSGGPDSMALLHVLWELAPRLSLALEVTTVNHGLRAEAAAEAQQVAERAAALELPWHPLAVDVRAARREARGTSWQEAARVVRLAALEALAARLGAQRVALGHQADDQAETVLFRILRGTGVHGLAGIPYRRDPFIRPLLDVRRTAIDAYLKRRSIPCVSDPSNADLRYARARIRQQLLPLLRQENPRIVDALLALSADAARRSEVGVEGEGEGEGEGAGMPAGAAPAGDAPRRIAVARGAAAAIERLKRRGGSASVDVRGGRFDISYGQSRFVAEPAGRRGVSGRRPPAATAAPREVAIVSAGAYTWRAAAAPAAEPSPAAGFTVEVVEEARAPSAQDRDAGALFDADLLQRPLRLRARRAGDRMVPRGGRGSRKLSDLLIDAKVARAARAGVPVLTTADDVILFVPGLRPSEFGRPSDATRRWVRVKATPGAAGE